MPQIDLGRQGRDGSLGTAEFAPNTIPSSALQEVTVNIPDGLVKLDNLGRLPSVDGSQLTNLTLGELISTVDLGDVEGVVNTADGLVKLLADGKLPALDGSNLVNLPLLESISTADLSDVEGAVNTADGLVKLDGLGKLPALDGSNLTNLSITEAISTVDLTDVEGAVNTANGLVKLGTSAVLNLGSTNTVNLGQPNFTTTSSITRTFMSASPSAVSIGGAIPVVTITGDNRGQLRVHQGGVVVGDQDTNPVSSKEFVVRGRMLVTNKASPFFTTSDFQCDTEVRAGTDLGAGQNLRVGSLSADIGGGVGVVALQNATTAPTTNPTSGGVLYTDNGLLKFRRSSGVTDTLSSFVDQETPNGTVDGVNTTFTLSQIPAVGSVHLFLNGVLQRAGAGNDYTISGDTITFNTAPQSNSELVASYRV